MVRACCVCALLCSICFVGGVLCAEDQPKQSAVSEALLSQIKSGANAQKLHALKLVAKQQAQPVPAPVSQRLFNAALLDESEQVREEAARTIKTLEDKQAMTYLYQSSLHPKMPASFRARAAEALRTVDNPEIVAAYVHLVTYEMRFGTAREVNPPQQIFLTNGGDINNPLGNINLPIELPELELTSVQTSFSMYAASALGTISRQNFGLQPAAWKRWLDEYKHIREVREKAEQEYENAE